MHCLDSRLSSVVSIHLPIFVMPAISILGIYFVYRKAELPLILILMLQMHVHMWKGKHRKGKERKGRVASQGELGGGWMKEVVRRRRLRGQIALSLITGTTKQAKERVEGWSGGGMEFDGGGKVHPSSENAMSTGFLSMLGGSIVSVT